MRKVYLLFIALAYVLTVVAQIRGNEIRVVVSPDHDDWTYRLNEKSMFTIQVWKAQNLLSGVTVDYELGPEMYPTEKKKGVVLKDGSLKLQGTMTTPGFLRCKVTAHVDGRTYEGLATSAYAPEQLKPVTEMPADFREYWAETLEKARTTTPLNPVMTLLPERCTEMDNVYQVSFQTKARGGRFYGILCMPKAEGKYPALLRVPGAGVRPYTGDIYTAPGKVITLEVGIHGIPVTMQQSVYDALSSGALVNYPTFGRDNQDAFYYNRVIVGALRAVDLICSLPQHNGVLGVTGSSQGGALTVITAALDTRVKFFAAVHPAMCDHEAFFKKRACGWPHYFYNNGAPNEKELKTVRYYDVANFARCLNVPGWFSWGYNDNVCPPTSMYAAYNVIDAPKELHPYLETGHYWYQEQWNEWLDWLREQLGVK